MFRAGYSMQADGTMARCNETGEEYTVTYTKIYLFVFPQKQINHFYPSAAQMSTL